MVVSFNELRRIKDQLPDGSIHKIADALNISDESVRNYFGGHDFDHGKSMGVHIEQGGPDGGMVELDDDTILNFARKIIEEN
jgi:hypothetical protein